MNELIIRKNDQYLIDPQVANMIAEYSIAIKIAEQKLDELKAALKEEMKEKNVIDLQSDDGKTKVVVKYVLPTDQETFDKSSFKKAFPDLYDRFITMKRKAGYITVKVSK